MPNLLYQRQYGALLLLLQCRQNPDLLAEHAWFNQLQISKPGLSWLDAISSLQSLEDGTKMDFKHVPDQVDPHRVVGAYGTTGGLGSKQLPGTDGGGECTAAGEDTPGKHKQDCAVSGMMIAGAGGLERCC